MRHTHLALDERRPLTPGEIPNKLHGENFDDGPRGGGRSELFSEHALHDSVV